MSVLILTLSENVDGSADDDQEDDDDEKPYQPGERSNNSKEVRHLLKKYSIVIIKHS